MKEMSIDFSGLNTSSKSNFLGGQQRHEIKRSLVDWLWELHFSRVGVNWGLEKGVERGEGRQATGFEEGEGLRVNRKTGTEPDGMGRRLV